ncbi:MAG: DUF4351 domain-containing protein [Burkholderiaceae bacterium]|nr:DUF4351 domain-containing protein [Burkholderiaceae bacterium]
MPLPIDAYDTPWKEAVSRYFPEFMAFYFSDAHAAIDWGQPYIFLDKELAQVVQDAELGKRLADQLVQVATLSGGQEWVLVHIEVQGGRDSGFAERIFTYNYRLYDRYRRPVASLALLADKGAKWRPTGFGYRLFGCAMRLDFPVVKLSDYAGRIEELLLDPNPFALVTAAHLLTQKSRRDTTARGAAKWRLARLLYQRNWDKQRIIDLFSVIDWMMRLPADLEAELWRDIQEWERSDTMPYVTSVERIGLERGLKLGREEGRQEGQSLLLARQLTKRFGPLPEHIQQRLAQASAVQLEMWAEAVLDASKLSDVFG